ncbi:MAG: hypothetical protein Q8S17_03640, partial [Humidesulfovibrio sp.]|nr:hypothetical protein [Humidesulfovibrio sp.]
MGDASPNASPNDRPDVRPHACPNDRPKVWPNAWQVWLASPPYAALTYLCPAWFPEPQPGLRVLAPLGRGLRVGVLKEPAKALPQGVDLKPLVWPLEHEP